MNTEPCPFCGAEAVIIPKITSVVDEGETLIKASGYRIMCVNACVMMPPRNWMCKLSTLVGLWNNRIKK
jgi:hypothetical protein